MTRITETKSVKVDNWGVFFLQKLQNFFNKTDHCDLTLQFNDNSQLKVHRLVLSACTDYFNMLENTCEMYDDVLIMPLDLQADVIVPIVNFMYTGTLEFQYSIYEKLLKTARDMNMTVLLKLLEAHKQTTNRMAFQGKQPILLNKQAPRGPGTGIRSNFNASTVQRSYGVAGRGGATVGNRGIQQQSRPVVHRQTTIVPVSNKQYSPNKTVSIPEPQQLMAKYAVSRETPAGPSRFDDTAITSDGFEGAFEDMSYESRPLVTADQIKKEEETSPFEKLRKGYTNINVMKRPASNAIAGPTAKKPNLDEVKEFTEAARLRSQIATEDDDSPGLEDDTRFVEEDEQQQQAIKTSPKSYGSPGKQIIIKQEATSPGTAAAIKQITVKDESGNVDHAKIISEVLKKYPHLVKKNKNIKLKIMQKTSPTAQAGPATHKVQVNTATPLKSDAAMIRKATDSIQRAPIASSTPGPKKIDSKTMHALIAKGAENMTGPWLCLRCGVGGRPISIPNYKAFRNHLIVKHKEKIDARICEHCGWKAEQRNPHLFYHWLTEHNIKSTVKFPTCSECGHVAINASALQKHEDENHQRGDLQQCIYCNKVFAKEIELYEHMKSLHKDRAREDGVIDFSDEEYHMGEEEQMMTAHGSSGSEKIKIISNISLAASGTIPFVIDPSQVQTISQIGGKSSLQIQQITLEPSSEAEALSNVASGIATSLGLVDSSGVVIEDSNFQGAQYVEHQLASVHGESSGGADQLTKLITEDGTELQLTQSQKEEIMSQLQNSGNGNVVMVLNDDNFIGGSSITLEDGSHLITTSADHHDPNAVLMYTQAGDVLTGVTESGSGMLAVTTTSTLEQDEQPQQHIDETSQASVQPSEAVSEKVGEAGENNQESVQQVERTVKAEAEEDDEVEEEDEDEKAEKAAKEREKQKLISELEGDWSEDTEDNQQPNAEEEKQAEAPVAKSNKPAAASKETSEKTENKTETPSLNDKEIDDLLDDWNNDSKPANDEDTESKPVEEKIPDKDPVEPEKEEPTPMETSTGDGEHTADDSIGGASSVNDSETQIVIMAAESETETSLKEDETSQGEGEAATAAETDKDASTETPKDADTGKSEPEEKETEQSTDRAKEEDNDQQPKEEDEDKTKSKKEVVNSLLGDWDEDEDM
ncbi:centrosome-associated zinc finger protein CP190 [Uranotaenia lowii]|uniref:centrosome-associated zinc finger protein CP190 n=1 Tax=Uranotaenia lowii TaxID=190385 RepID=UPI002479A7A5|nr:centrosome-associated zinc finger protein CP190 [Uranotaenia lowii]XP_055612998.1 centrosome-associated zinc finger protein CP190 [Uranotaenia lowii]XP_055612999.1 centrosome-associated zinc finger protein CP190 [Uranotaenia lowii]XP_055613000.1 centrosome-associated zinc finger protein CP190 [Uranotaenia lowii]